MHKVKPTYFEPTVIEFPLLSILLTTVNLPILMRMKIPAFYGQSLCRILQILPRISNFSKKTGYKTIKQSIKLEKMLNVYLELN